MDSQGVVYVTDICNDCVQKFSYLASSLDSLAVQVQDMERYMNQLVLQLISKTMRSSAIHRYNEYQYMYSQILEDLSIAFTYVMRIKTQILMIRASSSLQE